MLVEKIQLQDGDSFRRYDTIAIPQNVDDIVEAHNTSGGLICAPDAASFTALRDALLR
uniref:hypothetical protein n=1 Tax=unclassified Variovorax TaxID=663243 RepID=UPI000D480F41